MLIKSLTANIPNLSEGLDFNLKPDFMTRVVNSLIQSPIVPSSLRKKVVRMRKDALIEAEKIAQAAYDGKTLGTAEKANLISKSVNYLSYYLDKIQCTDSTETVAISINEEALEGTFKDWYYLREIVYKRMIDKLAEQCELGIREDGLINFDNLDVSAPLRGLRLHVMKTETTIDVENDLRLAVIQKYDSVKQLERNKAKSILKAHPVIQEEVKELTDAILREKDNLEAYNKGHPERKVIVDRMIRLHQYRKMKLNKINFYNQIEAYRTNLYAFGFRQEDLPKTYPEFIGFFANRLKSEFDKLEDTSLKHLKTFDPYAIKRSIAVIARNTEAFQSIFRRCNDTVMVNYKNPKAQFMHLGAEYENSDQSKPDANPVLTSNDLIKEHLIRVLFKKSPLSYQRFIEKCKEKENVRIDQETLGHWTDEIYKTDPQAFEDCKTHKERVNKLKNDLLFGERGLKQFEAYKNAPPPPPPPISSSNE